MLTAYCINAFGADRQSEIIFRIKRIDEEEKNCRPNFEVKMATS